MPQYHDFQNMSIRWQIKLKLKNPLKRNGSRSKGVRVLKSSPLHLILSAKSLCSPRLLFRCQTLIQVVSFHFLGLHTQNWNYWK